MSKRIDRTGERFGRLTIVRFAGVGKNWVGIWECICDCGNIVKVQYNNLYNGTTRSCGCLKREVTTKRSTKHGLSGGHGHYTRLYYIWLNMRRRCFSKKSLDYRYYGGRGITICAEWSDYANFYNWAMANGYRDDLTLERIDNNGNYEPSNCRWVTRKEQARNTRQNHLISFNGETKTLAEWAETYGLNRSALLARLQRGWPIELALTTPSRIGNRLKNILKEVI